jgi:hypothetical protein
MQNMYCGESTGMSNSQIAQAADEAFSQHKRLDTDCASSHNELSNNPLGSFKTSKLQLRKRKKNIDTDFVSGLFRDLNEASLTDQFQYNSNEDPAEVSLVSDDDNAPVSKKARVAFNTLSRSYKSFSHLSTLCNDTQKTSSDSSHDRRPHGRRVSCNIHQVSPNPSLASDGTINPESINEIVDLVLSETLGFPCLPPTVSETSCTSNNLTQTTVQAAQVLETPSSPSFIEGGKHDQKDSYGWFVDMDIEENHNRADDVTAARKSLAYGCDEDLSFKAATAPKKTIELDEEVQFALAADTVDDVLGDFF